MAFAEVDGVKIRVQAETGQFKKDLKGLTVKLDKFGKTIDDNIGEKTTKGTKDAKNGLRRAFSATALSPFLNSIKHFGIASIAAFTAVATSIGLARLSLSDALNEFAKLDVATDVMEKLKSQAMLLASQYAFSFDEIAKVMSDLKRTFKDLSGQALDDATLLMLKFAEATGVDATSAVKNLQHIMTQMGVSFDEASKFLEVTTRLSQQIVGFNGEQFLDFLGESSVMLKELSQNQIKDIIALYASMEKSGGDVATIQQLINSAFEDSVATGEKFENVWKRYFTTLRDANIEDKEFIRIAKLLNIEASELKKIISSTNMNFDEFRDIINKSGSSIDDVYNKLDPFSKQWTILKNNVSNFLGILGQALLPILQIVSGALQLLTSLLINAEGGFTTLGIVVIAAVSAFLALTTIPAIIGLISKAVTFLAIKMKAVMAATLALKFALLGLGGLGIVLSLLGLFGGLGSSSSGGDSGSGKIEGLSSIKKNVLQNIQANVLPQKKELGLMTKGNESFVVNNQIISNTNIDGEVVARKVVKNIKTLSKATSQFLQEK